MRAIIGRIVGVLGGGIIVFLTDTVGIDVTPEATTAITEGLNLLGSAVFLVGYAVVHKLTNRFIAPADTAT
jgi:hypothetical protein